MQEIWKDVPGYDGIYQVSNQGRVRSFKRNKWKLMCPVNNWNGYPRLALTKDKIKHNFLVHRLVWICFNGDIPNGYEVNHINEIKTDNRLENLNLMTRKDNINWGTCVKRRTKTLKERSTLNTGE